MQKIVLSFILLGSQISAHGDYNHKIKRCLLLVWKNKKSYDKLGLDKAMAPHSSTLAWKIPRMEEPGRLQSRGLLRVGHD